MILTFDYPRYKNIYDRRLWSEVNTNLIFEHKEYNLKNTIVVVTVFKKHYKLYPRFYFNRNELKDLIAIILTRSNIKFTINKYLYKEKEIDGKARIQLEFLTKGMFKK